MPRCVYCTSDYKVDEFNGVLVCHGFCRRKVPAMVASSENQVAAADPPSSVRASPASRKLSPSWKQGDHVRAACPLADNEILEGVITAVSPDNTKVKVQAIGHDQSFKVLMKDLIPSRGKEAREKQVNSNAEPDSRIEKGLESGGATSAWNVGDECRAIFSEDGVEYRAVIESITGTSCVVKYVDYGNSESKPLSELKPAPSKPKVGDAVRAVYSEDSVEYEAVVKSIGESEGQEYAIVEFVGYGNEDTAWLTDLKPSSGPLAVKEQKKAAGVDVEEEKEVPPEAAKEDAKAPEPQPDPPVPAAEEPVPSPQGWEVNEYCRAVYSEDGMEYEGRIMAVGESEGYKYFTVRFLGYGNEENVWEESMMPSKGKEARRLQRHAAGEEVTAEEPVEPDTTAAVEKEPESKPIKEEPKAPEASEPTPPPAVPNETQPTPAVQEWKLGDACRALYHEDGVEYEADIADIKTEDCGNKSATVVFVGYGNEEQVWLDDLLESKPDERKAVMASFGLEEEATEATPETASTAPATAETAQPETKPAASPAVLTSAEVTSTSAVIEQPKPAPVAEAVKAIEAKKESKISEGDYCRVVYQGSERPELCGQDFEAMVFTVDGAKITARIIGPTNVYQVVNADQLKASGGSKAREEQVMRFQSERASPVTNNSGVNGAAGDSSRQPLPSLATLGGEISDATHGLSIVQDLLNELSSELDQTAKIHTLEKRNQDLLESETSLKDQNEALRRGNRELMHQLQANTTAVAEKGGITEKEIKDTVQVALLNLQAEKKRYDELKHHHLRKLEEAASDATRLMVKLEEQKAETQRLKRESMLAKQRERELHEEIVALKSAKY